MSLYLTSQGMHFYLVMLWVSAVFAVAQCPSVSLSVTMVDCIQTADSIVKLHSRPGSPITLVFDPMCRYPIRRGTPSVGVQNTRGWQNFAIFDGSRHLSQKRYEIGSWLLWNVNRKSYMHSIDIFNDLDGPLTQFLKSQRIRDKVTVEH